MFCAIGLNCSSQIVHERSHTDHEAVGVFLLGNTEGKCIYSAHVLPSMGQVIHSCKTLFNLSRDICNCFSFKLRCLHSEYILSFLVSGIPTCSFQPDSN